MARVSRFMGRDHANPEAGFQPDIWAQRIGVHELRAAVAAALGNELLPVASSAEGAALGNEQLPRAGAAASAAAGAAAGDAAVAAAGAAAGNAAVAALRSGLQHPAGAAAATPCREAMPAAAPASASLDITPRGAGDDFIPVSGAGCDGDAFMKDASCAEAGRGAEQPIMGVVSGAVAKELDSKHAACEAGGAGGAVGGTEAVAAHAPSSDGAAAAAADGSAQAAKQQAKEEKEARPWHWIVPLSVVQPHGAAAAAAATAPASLPTFSLETTMAPVAADGDGGLTLASLAAAASAGAARGSNAAGSTGALDPDTADATSGSFAARAAAGAAGDGSGASGPTAGVAGGITALGRPPRVNGTPPAAPLAIDWQAVVALAGGLQPLDAVATPLSKLQVRH